MFVECLNFNKIKKTIEDALKIIANIQLGKMSGSNWWTCSRENCASAMPYFHLTNYDIQLFLFAQSFQIICNIVVVRVCIYIIFCQNYVIREMKNGLVFFIDWNPEPREK